MGGMTREGSDGEEMPAPIHEPHSIISGCVRLTNAAAQHACTSKFDKPSRRRTAVAKLAMHEEDLSVARLTDGDAWSPSRGCGKLCSSGWTPSYLATPP